MDRIICLCVCVCVREGTQQTQQIRKRFLKHTRCVRLWKSHREGGVVGFRIWRGGKTSWIHNTYRVQRSLWNWTVFHVGNWCRWYFLTMTWHLRIFCSDFTWKGGGPFFFCLTTTCHFWIWEKNRLEMVCVWIIFYVFQLDYRVSVQFLEWNFENYTLFVPANELKQILSAKTGNQTKPQQ